MKNQFSKLLLIAGISLTQTHCSSYSEEAFYFAEPIGKDSLYTEDTGDSEPEVVPDEIEEVLTEKADELQREPVQIGSESDEINESLKGGIPLELNDDVQRWINYFTGRNRERFQRFLDRGEQYKTMIVGTLKDQGVPTELYYLAMIESGFVTSARSHASAVGLWQFIRGTGKRYGLRIDSHVDERRDPMRATISASIYLNDLKNVFDSWYLAMAAYNAGEMRILRAIMKGKTRDFWELARAKRLPAETMNYIPKFLAALTIGSNPTKYGFTINPVHDRPILEAVNVPTPVSLSKVAKAAGLSLRDLKLYNPHFLKNVTPPSRKDYPVWVPANHSGQLTAELSNLKKAKLNIRVAHSTPEKGRKYHRVRKGENLASISKKYNLKIAELKKLNSLRSNRIYAGARLKITGAATPAKKQRYRVRRGDNLYSIAKKFQTTIKAIKKSNKIRRNKIYAGQMLTINRAG